MHEQHMAAGLFGKRQRKKSDYRPPPPPAPSLLPELWHWIR